MGFRLSFSVCLLPSRCLVLRAAGAGRFCCCMAVGWFGAAGCCLLSFVRLSGFPAGAAGGYGVRWLVLLPCWLWLLYGCRLAVVVGCWVGCGVASCCGAAGVCACGGRCFGAGCCCACFLLCCFSLLLVVRWWCFGAAAVGLGCFLLCRVSAAFRVRGWFPCCWLAV